MRFRRDRCWWCEAPSDVRVVDRDGREHELCAGCAQAKFPHAEVLTTQEARERMGLGGES